MHSRHWASLAAGTALAGALLAGGAAAQKNPRTSFFGGSAHDRAQGCAVDATGRVLVTGNTGSNNLGTTLPPAKGGYQKTFQGTSDAFVAVLSPDLSTVIAWTYLGGALDERGYAVRADAQGRIWVLGFTESSDFPHTTAAPQHGDKDVFVARFSPDLKQLQMCTLVGGAGEENARASFEIDAQGNAYFSGHTTSLDYPATAGAIQTAHAPGATGSWDGFVTKIDAQGQIVWSTYLGGTGNDAAYSGLALASDGSVVVAGMTNSSDLPVTPNALQTAYGGDSGQGPFTGDGFVARLSPDGKQLVYCTYLGGAEDDMVAVNDALVLDAHDDATLIGQTRSPDFPMPSGGWSDTYSPAHGNEGYLVKLSADGSQLLGGTYFGGSDFEEASGLELDSSGNVYVSGNTESADYPVTLDAVQSSYAGGVDAFITKFSDDYKDLLYSTYLGGSGSSGFGDRGRTLVLNVHNNNEVVLSGDTDSQDFPTTSQAFDPNYDGGSSDGFVSSVSLGDTYVVGQGKKTSQNKFSTLTWTGSPSQSGGSFTIQAKNAVAFRRGMLVWGDAIAPKPFQGGTLYAQTPLHRLPTHNADASGSTSYAIQIVPGMVGRTRVYQYLFEDPGQSDGTKIAMSNALKVVFTP